MNIDWKKVWEFARPYVYAFVVRVVLPLLAGTSGVALYGECCLKPAVQKAVFAAAQK